MLNRQKKFTIAICYDFDGTLSPNNMQEYSFIPKLQQEPKKFWEDTSKIAKQNKVDLWINDHTKNTQHLNANFECIPLTNLPDNVTVTYSSNKRYAVVVRLSGQKYLLSEYTLIFENTFLKPQDIILDLQRWYHDFRDAEEVFDNEQSAILRTNQLINEYQSNNP